MISELIIAGASFFHPQVMVDSIGTETINGKVFVLHQVGEKETVYAISRRYGVTVETIVMYNPGAESRLDVGQIVKVLYVPKKPAAATTVSDGSRHVVAAKETMYSISQTHGITIDEIKQWNNLTSNALSIGQELIVRRPQGSRPAPAQPAPVSTTAVVTQNADGTHIVAPKETMYSISRQYNISVEDIKAWNGLEGNDISVGQELIVSAQKAAATGYTATNTTNAPSNRKPYQVSPPPATTTPEPKRDNPPVATTAPVSTSTPSSTGAQTGPESTRADGSTIPRAEQTVRISESVKSSDEVLESGLAELIEGTDGNRKYLALHRTAPVGTILKVRNEMNNREVFVRVMGKLPTNALTDKLVIRISKSAYDRLGAIDPRFRVEVTYYK